jgi:hypothetical protein
MEYEIDELDVLLDASTNPSLMRRPKPAASRHTRLASWKRRPSRQTAVVIPEEEEQFA